MFKFEKKIKECPNQPLFPNNHKDIRVVVQVLNDLIDSFNDLVEEFNELKWELDALKNENKTGVS